MTTITKGQKWRYIGPGSEFYTPGKVYEVIALAASRGDMLQMTDDLGDMPHHWTEESMSGLFEVANGPVITETRKRVVPGVYDRIEITRVADDRATVTFADTAWAGRPHLNATELRAAASVLTEIADALDGAK